MDYHVSDDGVGIFTVDNAGRSIDYTDNHLLNSYWAHMHRQWGHQSDTKLNGDAQVNNNQNSRDNDDDSANVGDSWGHAWTGAWKDQPWAGDDDRSPSNIASSWGSDHGFDDFQPSAYNEWEGRFFDASWELGNSPLDFGNIATDTIHFDTTFDGNGVTTISGGPNLAIYAGHRWFEGIDTGLNAGDGEVNDPAKLKCHTCDIQREMWWDSSAGIFRLVDPTQAGRTDKNNENLWAECHQNLNQKSCEYSSGTCFVEERRTWGYITQVRAGCKQAQACYMQKYQNFLVKAGRQCWPGDHTGMADKIARRPYDVMADQWVSNIVRGGITTGGGTGSSFGEGGHFAGSPFDDTFTDAAGLGLDGFYVSDALTSSNEFHVANSYQNGMKESSKCYQCCNTEHNCNFNWQPLTEADWEHAYVWRYDTSAFSSGQFGTGLENNPRINTPVVG